MLMLLVLLLQEVCGIKPVPGPVPRGGQWTAGVDVWAQVDSAMATVAVAVAVATSVPTMPSPMPTPLPTAMPTAIV